MCPPAAKQDDMVVGVDTHIVLVPTPAGPSPTPLPHPFSGSLSDSLSPDVSIEGKPAAVVGSTANNSPEHIPTPPGTAFTAPPANRGTVMQGSTSVLINGQPAARAGDPVMTCNDPADAPVGNVVVAFCTVEIGP